MKIKNLILFILALLPQIVFEKYLFVLIFTCTIGFIGGWFIEDKKVFLKILLIQFVFFASLFYFKSINVSYLEQVLENLGLSVILLPIVFILFNTVNISILFLFGYRFHQLIFNKIKF